MAMGVVNDADFEKELASLTRKEIKIETNTPLPAITGEVMEIEKPGRKEGDVNVPSSLRALIAATHVEESRRDALEFAESVGVSSSSVSAYAKGANSTASYQNPNQQLQSTVVSAKGRVATKARRRLNMALDGITPDKIAAAKVKDIAGIAKDMSVVMRNMEDGEKGPVDNGAPRIVIFAPQIRQENHFEMMEVDE